MYKNLTPELYQIMDGRTIVEIAQRAIELSRGSIDFVADECIDEYQLLIRHYLANWTESNDELSREYDEAVRELLLTASVEITFRKIEHD